MFQESSCTLKYVDSIVKTREEHKVNNGLRNGRYVLYDMTSGDKTKVVKYSEGKVEE
ncbi:MAG TPA: hypothetical protein PKE52_03315 [Bacteroidales bacterium]|nr:hypothetical protein [Bacteroidales bacterium]